MRYYLKGEHVFIGMRESLMGNAYTDKQVAEIFSSMRLALDKDPAFADCYPMGIDGMRRRIACLQCCIPSTREPTRGND